MTDRVAVQVARAAAADLGEGPVWDDRDGELVWLDITRHEVHRFDPSTGMDRSFDLGQPVGSVGLRNGGGLIAALRDGFARVDDAGQSVFIAPTEAENEATRMNDGKVDPSGRFWAGSMALDARPGAGTLYRLDPDGRVHAMVTDLAISNGLDWSADRRLMYFIDSPTYRVDVFDYDDETGAIRDRRAFCEIGSGETMPDGMTVDADGHLWVAVWGGSCVLRFAPDGTPSGRVALPASQVTSCAFGGADLRDLYITTASRGLTPGQRAREPYAGALFVCRPGPRGLPPHRFRG